MGRRLLLLIPGQIPDPEQETKARRAAAAERRYTRWEKTIGSMLVRYFGRQERVVMERFKGTKVRKGTRFWDPPGTKAVESQALLDRARWAQELAEEYGPILADIYAEVAAELDVDLDVKATHIANRIKERVGRLAIINDTTRRELAQTLREGERAGDTSAQMETRIKAVYAKAATYRAELIASSEAVSASNEAQLASALELGEEFVPVKTWFSSRDTRVRPTHRHADGQRVKLTERFKVGKYKMLYPGDPAGGPEEVINCRCVMLYDAPKAHIRQLELKHLGPGPHPSGTPQSVHAAGRALHHLREFRTPSDRSVRGLEAREWFLAGVTGAPRSNSMDTFGWPKAPMLTQEQRGERKADIAKELASRISYDDLGPFIPNANSYLENIDHAHGSEEAGDYGLWINQWGDLTIKHKKAEPRPILAPDGKTVHYTEGDMRAAGLSYMKRVGDLDSPEAEEAIKANAISALVTTWAGTSNDLSPRSLALQEVAEEMFGIPHAAEWNTSSSLREDIARERAENDRSFRAFLQAQYDYTQEKLAEANMDEVLLYRGFSWTENERGEPEWAKDQFPLPAYKFYKGDRIWDPARQEYGTISARSEPYGTRLRFMVRPESGGDPYVLEVGRSDPISQTRTVGEIRTIEAPLRPVSAWSTDPSTAMAFADSGEKSLLVRAAVPKERILGTALTGWGCLEEWEMVVLGGKVNVEVLPMPVLTGEFEYQTPDRRFAPPDWFTEGYEPFDRPDAVFKPGADVTPKQETFVATEQEADILSWLAGPPFNAETPAETPPPNLELAKNYLPSLLDPDVLATLQDPTIPVPKGKEQVYANALGLLNTLDHATIGGLIIGQPFDPLTAEQTNNMPDSAFYNWLTLHKPETVAWQYEVTHQPVSPPLVGPMGATEQPGLDQFLADEESAEQLHYAKINASVLRDPEVIAFLRTNTAIPAGKMQSVDVATALLAKHPKSYIAQLFWSEPLTADARAEFDTMTMPEFLDWIAYRNDKAKV